MRNLAAAHVIVHSPPGAPDALTPTYDALTTGERAVRRAYVRRERARRLARRRAVLARTLVGAIPRPRTPEPR